LLTWPTPLGVLVALEPTASEVAAHAPALAGFYDDPHNRALLEHAAGLGARDVIDHYEALASRGDRAFLLFRDDALAGDADLRHVRGAVAEFAFLVGARADQGQGLGTRFATLVHAFAFGPLALERTYASVLPHNVASQRSLAKLGYARDDGSEARAFADEPHDIVLALPRATFEAIAGDAVREIRVRARSR
jgi:RimJ/RimL family protein N-acetyltransferase